jgi:hypothetical protein
MPHGHRLSVSRLQIIVDMWCIRSDPCGLVCAWMTTALLLYAAYVEVFVVIEPMYGRYSLWSFANILFTFMALWSHFRCQLSDPGSVPKHLVRMYPYC